MSYRVLVVDDFEPWRRHIASALGESSRWQIVGEASDGSEAIEKAADLRPDLILLDVGLPTVNGIEAARRMLARDPNLKILFVSEHQSWEIAEAALCTGARGYICKSDSGRELAPAMDAVIDGGRFVAERFGGRVQTRVHGASANGHRHEAVYYSSDELLLEHWASIAEDALKAGATFILVGSDARRSRLDAMLEARGLNIARAVRDGRYVSASVPEVVSKWMVDGLLDETRFWTAATSIMLAASRASTADPSQVVACGECAPSLCAQGDGEAAIRLEELWEEVAATYHLDVFCSYTADSCRCDDADDLISRIRETHTAIYTR